MPSRTISRHLAPSHRLVAASLALAIAALFDVSAGIASFGVAGRTATISGMKLSWSSTFLAAALGVAACSDDPADLAGEYSASITLRDNGCNLAGWQVGSTSSAIPVSITQSGDTASASVGGLAALALELTLGGAIFTGSVSSNDFELRVVGTQPQTTGNCTFTYDGELSGTLSGDSISGKLSFTTATNNNSDCAPIKTCVSFQDFAASRPPR
jgi:hypothetical protein